MKYAPIHNHSEYSALDGLSTCREIAERCQEIGVEAVGISDHGTVSGHLEFAEVMAEHQIRPVFGCELYHGVKTEFGKQERDQAHFLAGALTDEGLRNLWRLVDKASTNFRFVGRVNFDMLKEHSEGVFATSACFSGLVTKQIREGDTDALNRYLDIYRDNFFIELHTYPGDDQEAVNVALVNVAKERGIPLIYATDAHFASPDQYPIHDAYVAKSTGENVLMPVEKRKMWHPKSLYIQNEEEIRASLSYLSESTVDEALRNSSELAERCNASLPEVSRHLPKFVPSRSPWVKGDDQAFSAASLLLKEVEAGIIARYGEQASEEVWDRSIQELEVFIDAGLEHYFLQVWDLVQFCEENGIRRGPGRGSAAGSIIAYALGITDIDPLKYDLIFERFYNPGREKGFPDIDLDFPTKDRSKVKKYLEDRWGQDKVRAIGTIRRMKPKAVIENTYKIYGITFTDMDKLKRVIDGVPDIDILGSDSIGWSEEIDPGKTIYVMDHVGPGILKWVEGLKGTDTVNREHYQSRALQWLDLLEAVCSRVEGYGVHPSGIVVSDVELADELPCMWNNNKKTQVTCFPMDAVDLRQFVKDDLLGLRNLDTLDSWERMVLDQGLVPENMLKKDGKEIDWQAVEEHHGSKLWDLFAHGLTLGTFQIEDGYARHLCKEFKPRSIEDLGIIVALNRPGPIRSGACDSFIARRRGEEETTYDDPILEDVLNETYGWFLYQEQVIRFFTKLGYNLADADGVRKILGKKKPEQMKALYAGEGEWTDRGYMAMAEKAGLAESVAQRIWDKLEDFAKYSFNKSHAIAYATLTFRTAFAKDWASPEYVIACVITVSEDKSKSAEDVGKYIGEARRMSIRVLPPSIDKSEATIAKVGENEDIYYGFSNIKGIGKGSGQFICDLRETYILDSPEALYGAIEAEQEKWTAERDAAKQEGKPFKKKSPRQTLPQNRLPPLEQAGAFEVHEPRELSMSDQQRLEKEILGVIITDDCEEVFDRNGEGISDCDSYADLELSGEGHKVFIPGIVSNIVPRRTRKDNKAMGVVTVEYQGDQVEFVVFPREWKSYKFLWKERTPAIFGLTKTDRGVRFDRAIKLK